MIKPLSKLAKILKTRNHEEGIKSGQQDSLLSMFQQMGIQNPGIEPEMKEEVTEEIAQKRRDIERTIKKWPSLKK